MKSGRCKAAMYCSRECQVRDWKFRHKRTCHAWNGLENFVKEYKSWNVMNKQLLVQLSLLFIPKIDLRNKALVISIINHKVTIFLRNSVLWTKIPLL